MTNARSTLMGGPIPDSRRSETCGAWVGVIAVGFLAGFVVVAGGVGVVVLARGGRS